MVNNLEIFLANKLISCDTIVPLIMSIKKNNKDLEVNYYIYHYKSYMDIKKNELMYYALKQTGKLHFRGSSNVKNKFLKIILRFKEIFFLLMLFIKLLLGKAKIVHFGTFAQYPFKLFLYFFPDLIYLMERSCISKHKNVIILDNIVRERKKSTDVIPSSKNIIYFNENYFRDYDNVKINKFLMRNPRTFRTWYDYIMHYGLSKVKLELEDLKYDYNKGYFLYILGYLGELDYLYSKNTMKDIIPCTLKILSQYGNGMPILLKPHTLTDMNILNKILKEYNFKNIHLTYLHPSALSVNAKLVVSNHFSGTQSDAYFFGAKTVEYSHYSNLALEKTNGQSMNPNYIDHFINNDPEKFKKIIQGSLLVKNKNKVRNIFEDSSESSEIEKFLL